MKNQKRSKQIPLGKIRELVWRVEEVQNWPVDDEIRMLAEELFDRLDPLLGRLENKANESDDRRIHEIQDKLRPKTQKILWKEIDDNIDHHPGSVQQWYSLIAHAATVSGELHGAIDVQEFCARVDIRDVEAFGARIGTWEQVKQQKDRREQKREQKLSNTMARFAGKPQLKVVADDE